MADPEPTPPEPDDPPATPPSLWREPDCALDWTSAVLCPPFLAALARAQAAMQTLGKTARAEAGAGAPAYDYATNDSIIGELRRRLAAEGIAFVSSWRVFDPPDIRISEKQWLDWTVVVDFALLYGSTPAEGHAGYVGVLRGTASAVAIGSAGRPPDKSLYAARTSIAGAVALGLGAIDRAKVSDDEDINRRKGDDEASGGGRRRVTDRATVEAMSLAKDRMAKALQTLTAARKASGLPRRTYPELVAEAMGEGFEPRTAEQADACAEALMFAANDLRGDGDPT